MEKNNLNNGHIIEVTPDMFEQASNDFSEGNENLKKLLMFCFENGIKTTSCCSGHNGEKRPYVQFEFNEQNMKAILKMLKQLSLGDVINNLTFTNQPGVTSRFCILMQDDKYNEGFEQILETLQSEKEVELSEIDTTRQLIVKSLKNHNIPNSFLDIQEEKDSISIATGDDYLPVFPAEQELRPWIEDTWLVEYSKDSKDVDSTLRRLESRTKNIRYLTNYPYDKEKINEFWKNRDTTKSTIKIIPEDTRERQYEYGERNVVVVDVNVGSNIESFADEIMQLHQYGQACITKFNSFEIDSRDYSSADEIVNTYMQEYEKHEREKEENKTNNVTISEKFESRLEDEFEPKDSDIKQGYLKENIKNNISIEEDINEDPYIRVTNDAEVLIDDKPKSDDKKLYVVNAQASMEQRYGKNGVRDVTIIEPTLGTSIEDFSEAIMNLKHHIITRFNNFEIDSNAYQSPKEIVEAYMRHIQEHNNGTNELSSKQEQITPAEIESVVAIEPRTLQIMRETSVTKQLVQASEHEKNIETEKE